MEIAREEGYQKHFKEESLQELKFPVGFGRGEGVKPKTLNGFSMEPDQMIRGFVSDHMHFVRKQG